MSRYSPSVKASKGLEVLYTDPLPNELWEGRMWVISKNFVADFTLPAELTKYFNNSKAGATNIAVNAATATLDISSEAAVGDAGIVVLKDTINITATKTFNHKVKATSINAGTNSNGYFLNLALFNAEPAVDTAANFDTNKPLLRILQTAQGVLQIYRSTAASVSQWWDPVGAAWSTTLTSVSGAVGTQYQVILETNGTQLRATVKSADGMTTIIQSAWMPWTDVIPASNTKAVRLYWGDPYTTNHYTNYSTDMFTVS